MSDEKGEGQDDVGEEGCGGGARSRSRLADVNGGSTGGSDGRDRAVSGRRVSGRGRGLVARLLVLGLVVTVVASCARPVRRRPQPRPYGLPTIADRVAQYGSVARARLAPYFRAARVPYPPTRFVLLGLKQERELQLFAAGPGAAADVHQDVSDLRRQRRVLVL
jgi:hypothetical protein